VEGAGVGMVVMLVVAVAVGYRRTVPGRGAAEVVQEVRRREGRVLDIHAGGGP